MATCEASNEEGLQIRSRAGALRLEMTQSEFVYRRGLWDQWLQDAANLRLDGTLDHVEEPGWTSAQVRELFLENVSDGADASVQAARCRKVRQKTGLDLLQETRPDPANASGSAVSLAGRSPCLVRLVPYGRRQCCTCCDRHCPVCPGSPCAHLV